MQITFFSPNAAIIPHYSAEMRLARVLARRKSNQVSFLTCGSFFEKDCTVSRYLGLTTPNSNKMNPDACDECKKIIRISKVESKFNHSELNEYFTISEAKIFFDSRKVIASDPISFTYNGISFGKIAAYELLLEFKKGNIIFQKEQLQTLTNYVENCFRTYLAAIRYFSVVKPDRIVIFNAQYGAGAAFARAAAEKGIRVDALSFSNVLAGMRQYIRLWDWAVFKNVDPGLASWKNETLTPGLFDNFRISRSFRMIRKALSPWTYSSPAAGTDIRRYFEIAPEKKIILAVMNSLDEKFAAVTSGVLPESFASEMVFKDQEDWISSLAAYLNPRDDIVLIVRPHPREFPNKREKVLAEITKTRSLFFANLPGTVIVDYPKLKVPIEDYFSDVIGITTGWSSIGLEWQMRGKLCVSYDSTLPMYPVETHLTGNTKEEYFANIEKVISGNMDHVERYTTSAISWYLFSNFKGSARLGSSILEELFLEGFFKKTKISSAINRFFPNLKIWIDLHSIGLFPDRNKILRYFSKGSSSFLSNP
jgi:hypothetical protein